MRLLLLWTGLGLLLAGCAGTSPNPDFYTLTPVVGMSPPPALEPRPELRLGIGPVVLPEVLRRPQLVVRSGTHRLHYDEFSRWGADPGAEIERLLVFRLMEALGTAQVYPHPWPDARRLDYRVRVEVLDLDSDMQGVLRLRGHWVLLGPRGDQELEIHPIDLREPLGDASDPQNLVEAQGRLFARLADGIARRIAERSGAQGFPQG